ncbi:hypothetical protein [Smaragdicoccus niigatensis]|uniref:hypothetical protein n=1 Tax=Smaragdicoccus niigatensis TaxID=359359 RepID=UPI00036512AB|nr:hypothetical protein [Smaragdicoccus niigatensis]
MTDSKNGTRWGRALALIIGALIPAGFIGAAAASSALGAGLAMQSDQASFTTAGISTDDPLGIIVHPQLVKDKNGNTYTEYVVKLQASNAVARGICVAEKVSLFGQTLTILIESGDQEIQISGVSATIHTVSTSLKATGTVRLNQNAADVSAGGVSLGGAFGELGITAGGASLGSASGTLQGAMLKGGSISDLHARLVPGDVSCG